MVNLELYRVFDAVAKHGSLTKAAEALYLSQPAVSQSIKQLETQLGGTLFVRTPKGMVLTEIGAVMARYAEQAIELLQQAQGKFNEFKGIKLSTIRIGASDTFCKYYLLKFIDMFHKKHNVNMQVLNRTTAEIIELLKQRKIDLGFVNLPVYDPEVSIVEPCMELNDIFVYSPRFMVPEQNKVMPLKQLEDYPLLLLESTSNTRRSMAAFTQSLGIDLHADIELGSLDLIIEFALRGLGIASIPREYVEQELADGTLCELKTHPGLPVRGVGMATLNNIPLSSTAKEFIKIVRDAE